MYFGKTFIYLKESNFDAVKELGNRMVSLIQVTSWG